MTNLHHSHDARILPRALLTLACAFFIGFVLASDLRAADESAIRLLVEQMGRATQSYEPQPLLDEGLAGMKAVMDHVFPETAEEKKDLSAQVTALVEQLGDTSFNRREEATVALRQLSWKAVVVLRLSQDHVDAEVRSRVRKLIAEAEAQRETQEKTVGLQAYLDKVRDGDSQVELARRVTKALELRLDLTRKLEALRVCLLAMTKWPSDRVHGELLPLLKHEDSEPAIFAMKQISGRTGNDYVGALQMGAITSGRPELIKCGFRSIPCPVWDEKNRPKIHAVLAPLFDELPEHAELRSDDDFMCSAAFVGARDFKIPKARLWLIARMKWENKDKSLRAIQALGDTYYMRDALDAELFAALEPHLKSKDPKFRRAALYTLGVYKGEAVQPALLKAFADPVREVWQTAGERLRDQHSYYPQGSSPIPKLLESDLLATKDPLHRARLDFFLGYIKQEKPPYLTWPDLK